MPVPCEIGQTVKIGYFSQESESLDDNHAGH